MKNVRAGGAVAETYGGHKCQTARFWKDFGDTPTLPAPPRMRAEEARPNRGEPVPTDDTVR